MEFRIKAGPLVRAILYAISLGAVFFMELYMHLKFSIWAALLFGLLGAGLGAAIPFKAVSRIRLDSDRMYVYKRGREWHVFQRDGTLFTGQVHRHRGQYNKKTYHCTLVATPQGENTPVSFDCSLLGCEQFDVLAAQLGLFPEGELEWPNRAINFRKPL